MRHFIRFFAVFLIACCTYSAAFPEEAWEEGCFQIKEINGRKIFTDPSGKPFYSIAMCYAWGPDSGILSKEDKNFPKITADLNIMKEHGFNTLNLYGLHDLEEILTWCDKNNFAFYPRMSYYDLPDFPKTLKEFPDFMDPEFRESAKLYFDKYCPIFKKHPSVLAIDMDQRWMFPLDWGGEKHLGKPMLGQASIQQMPSWLKNKYKNITEINRLWKKNYKDFADILSDKEIIKDGAVLDLGRSPWRVDIYEYTLWTVNDFLKDITSYIRKIDQEKRLITITTEMPEVCPFPISTFENSGINFASPVHYNSQADFNRDWIGAGELLYMVKWHYDMQDMPAYISETGFRTSPLKQNPPFMLYAAGKPGDEDFIAEMYLRQSALLDIWPWMTGWTHFKMYDKLAEGDFGYIRDDRTLKPVSALGKYINSVLPINYKGEKEPEVWIFYPEYCLSSYYASYFQFKTLVLLLEYDFMQEFDKMVKKSSKYTKNPSDDIKNSRLIKDLQKVYDEKWVPFKFTSQVPEDDKPVIVAGRSLEQLSMTDREKLRGKKVITMVCAGTEDERYNKTEKWFLSGLGIDSSKADPDFIPADLQLLFNNDGISGGKTADGGNFYSGESYDENSLPKGGDLSCVKADAAFTFPENLPGKNNNMALKGQNLTVGEASYAYVHLLASADANDIVGKLYLNYSDGTREPAYIGETVADWKNPPHFGHYALEAKNNTGEAVYIGHYAVKCNAVKKLRSITFMENPKIHVFAVSLETARGIVKDVDVTVSFGRRRTKGKAYWMMPVEKRDFDGEVIASFSDGKVAVALNKQNRRAAFLYDSLTWAGSPDELSKDLNFTAAVLKRVISELNEKGRP